MSEHTHYGIKAGIYWPEKEEAQKAADEFPIGKYGPMFAFPRDCDQKPRIHVPWWMQILLVMSGATGFAFGQQVALLVQGK